jgi:glycosyltransferase involved in cell wall biosynthesis
MHSLLIPPVPVSKWPEVPVSDGFYESLGCDVIHFPFQHFVLCAIPSIFNPHDLQHLHFPRFFTPQTIAYREVMYPAGCRFANTVVVGSNWVKQDVIDKYHVSHDKVQVIPWAPPTQAYKQPPPEQLDRVKKTYSLDLPFALYPAVTWEHKNHLRLLEALAMVQVRDGIKISLVCTGGKYPGYWPKIESRIIELRLEDSVKFLGQVPPEDLRALYKLAQFVIVPTLFEAASGPVFEAWQEGTPVACSNVTSLPEQAGNAALLFDPLSIDDISEAIYKMSSEKNLRAELQHNGAIRLKDFDWERTAKAYRAVYRRASRHPLTEEDEHLLSWDWMRDPRSEERKRT